MTADELAAAIGAAAAYELDSALARIKHCLDQLNDAQVWHRSQPDLNSVGNLILHLGGNLRQWIVAGIGGAPDVRTRPAEFSERGPIPKGELLRGLESVVAAAKRVLAGVDSRQLTGLRRIQGFEITGLAAIFNSVPHFRGQHAGDHPHDPVAAGRRVPVRLDPHDTGARRACLLTTAHPMQPQEEQATAPFRGLSRVSGFRPAVDGGSAARFSLHCPSPVHGASRGPASAW